MCISPVVSRRPGFIGAPYPLWLFYSFHLHFCTVAWVRVMGLMETALPLSLTEYSTVSLFSILVLQLYFGLTCLYLRNRLWQNCPNHSCFLCSHSGQFLHSLILLGSSLADFPHLYPYHVPPGRVEPGSSLQALIFSVDSSTEQDIGFCPGTETGRDSC